MSDGTIRDPLDTRKRVALTTGVVKTLVERARKLPAYSSSHQVQAMADALELMAAEIKRLKLLAEFKPLEETR